VNPAAALAARIEDAGLNASAPPQQRWRDGWLLRFSPGKAKRARCINAVAAGRLALDDQLDYAHALYAQHGLPLLVRITPFSQPAGLDATLAARGMRQLDDTRVMVAPQLAAAPPAAPAWPRGVRVHAVGHHAFAQAVGQLRGSPLAQRQAHAERLERSPVPYRGLVLRRDDDAAVLACAQRASEGDLVGLYDVYTADAERSRGFARALCLQLLHDALAEGARAAYLQVEADNTRARALYARLGFADAYAYHYRTPDPDAR
jgi:ribosomal protein S18 acetylase RimI-like enzyme